MPHLHQTPYSDYNHVAAPCTTGTVPSEFWHEHHATMYDMWTHKALMSLTYTCDFPLCQHDDVDLAVLSFCTLAENFGATFLK